MAAPQNSPTQFGISLPTNYIWEIQQIENNPQINAENKEMWVKLYQNLGRVALVVNAKESSLYPLSEFVTNKQYFSNPSSGSAAQQNVDLRIPFRKVINFGALPNAGTKSVAHGITVTASTTWTIIEATATDTTGLTGVPIPYASCTDVAHNIELYVDNTNVNIITGSNRSNYNVCIVTLEYMQF